MIKTLKEILIKKEDGKLILIPTGTYLINKGFDDKFYFLHPDASDLYMESWHIEELPDRFIEVVSDEPEIYEIIRKFSDLLDRQDIRAVFDSIEKVDDETIQRIRKFFNVANVKELEDKVKDLETQLFAERMKQWTSPHAPINPLPNPYVSHPNTCQTCGIDFGKNTNYVCMNSACPSRTIWCSTSTDTTNTYPAGSNASYTIKKDEEE
jgi:hypothetical protein